MTDEWKPRGRWGRIMVDVVDVMGWAIVLFALAYVVFAFVLFFVVAPIVGIPGH